MTERVEAEEPDDWISEARGFCRPKIIAEGLSGADIDRMNNDERNEIPILKID